MIHWSGYEWLPQERWGQIHKDKPFCWYDPSAISIDENHCLHLKTQYNPKHFPELGITSNIGIGLVSCTNRFTHGTFEVEAKLPQGKNLWPAFWMYSWDSWPPEIDVFEGYSNNYGSYFTIDLDLRTGLKIWNVATNAWCIGDKAYDLGAQNAWSGFKRPDKNFMKYKVEWFPNKINFYYNEKLARVITDETLISQCNKTTMNVILNNHVRNPKGDTDSDFIIKYFKYTPY